MNLAAAKVRPIVRAASRLASQQEWKSCTDDIQAKVLSVDHARNAVEFLFKIAPGYRSNKHRHTCETHLFVIEGRVVNLSTGSELGPGDYCCQSCGDAHVQEFPDGAIVYGSYRGERDQLVEFYDDDGKLCGEFKASDFVAPAA